MLTQAQALEAIEVHGFVIGPEYKSGIIWPGTKQARIGYAVYADWVRAADDTFAEDSSASALAVAPTLSEAVELAVIRVNKRDDKTA